MKTMKRVPRPFSRSTACCDRRHLLGWAGTAAVSMLGLGGVWPSLFKAMAAPRPSLGLAGDPHRLVLIYLDGGWNAQLSVDPVYDDRATSGNFEAVYATHDIKGPPGKERLMTGMGLQDAFPAFSAMPTAFVNGMYVEIAAHDAAAAFMLTGKAAIGRTATQPAYPATLATRIGGIGSHLIFGGSLPLGDTVAQAPPITTSGGALGDLLSPAGSELKAGTQAAIERALAAVDDNFFASVGERAQKSLAPFQAAQRDLVEVFAQFGSKLKLSDELKARYGVKESAAMANFAAAYLSLQTGLSSIITIRFGGFDTHTNELNTQLPRQQQLAKVLNTFVADLRATPDPEAPGLSLADTTTMVMTSEFVRTAKFNDTAGTDHQNTASAVVMGKGVRDNTVAGGTDAMGEALGWEGGQTVERKDATRIDGGALVASLLDLFGMPEEAAKISERRVDGLFG